MDQKNINNRREEAFRRRQKFVVPKHNFIEKYPKLVIWGGTFIGLCAFFSKPIYDSFFRTEFPPPPPRFETYEERHEWHMKKWRV